MKRTTAVAAGLFLAAASLAALAPAHPADATSRADWPVLREGDSGTEVRTAQYLVSHHGFAVAKVDGEFGPDTRSKVASFQKARSLAADGVIGSATWSRLVVEVKAGSASAHAVNAAKVQLNKHGARLVLDGTADAATTEAVKAFQTRHKLTPSGTVDPATWQELVTTEDPGDGSSATAAQLLAQVKNCAKQVSNGTYSSDNGRGKYRFAANGRAALAGIRVCEKNGAVYWKADMDIDCDGQRTANCNKSTDPYYRPDTSCTQSNGRYLAAERLPFIVVPLKSSIWDPARSGLKCGTVGVVIYQGKMVYAVVGDRGPQRIIGEASYAAAKAVGINPHPSRGGVSSGVTYILFKGQQVSPLENHGKAVALGRKLGARFVKAG